MYSETMTCSNEQKEKKILTYVVIRLDVAPKYMTQAAIKLTD